MAGDGLNSEVRSVEMKDEQWSAAEAYNQAFDRDPNLRRLEQQKKDPVHGAATNDLQTSILDVAEKAAAKQMDYDRKTGLLNAYGINERLTEAAAKLYRENPDANITGESWLIIFSDINWFKAFNDGLGQTNGDEYIKGVASILESSVRSGEGDLAARHGGEEFMTVLRLKPGVDVDSVLWGKDDESSKGVLGRMGEGIKRLRDDWMEKNPEAFNKEIGFSSETSNLKEMGVGTLSVGIEYLTSNDVIQRYKAWVEDTKSGKTTKDFTNYCLVDGVNQVMKRVAKQKARFNQEAVVPAFVGIDSEDEVGASTRVKIPERNLLRD